MVVGRFAGPAKDESGFFLEKKENRLPCFKSFFVPVDEDDDAMVMI